MFDDDSSLDGLTVPDPIYCGQHWHRIIINQRKAIKGLENASKADCGPRKKHWRWYRDNRTSCELPLEQRHLHSVLCHGGTR